MALELIHQAKLLRAAELMKEAIRELSEVDAELQTEPDGLTPLDPVGLMLSSVINMTTRVVAGETLDEFAMTAVDGDDDRQVITIPLA